MAGPLKGKKRAFTDSETSQKKDPENQVQHAVSLLQSSLTTSINTAMTKFEVKYSTLHNRLLGIHHPNCDAHNQQLFDNAQTHILIDWCQYQACMGVPFNHVKVIEKATNLSGRLLGMHWATHFIKKKHIKDLHLASWHALNPKCARLSTQTPSLTTSSNSNFCTPTSPSPPTTFTTGTRRVYSWVEVGRTLGLTSSLMPRTRCTTTHVVRHQNVMLIFSISNLVPNFNLHNIHSLAHQIWHSTSSFQSISPYRISTAHDHSSHHIPAS
jgi:hypothetical protein